MKKKILIGLGVFTLFLAGAGYLQLIEWGFVKEPFKVTDPHDPRFNPERFRSSDYDTKEELHKAIKIVFPLGMPKEQVDRLMMKIYEAKPHKLLPSNVYTYSFNSFFGPGISHYVVFDESNQVLNVHFWGNKRLYKENIGYDELLKEWKAERDNR